MRMKLIHLLIMAILLLGVFDLLSSHAFCEAASSGEQKKYSSIYREGEVLASDISKSIGISISPLLGMSVLGAYNYITTPDAYRSQVALYNSPFFWGPLLTILILFILKDWLKTVLPIPKPLLVPLDALETVENKLSGILALPIVLSFISRIEPQNISALLQRSGVSLISTAYASEGIGETVLSNPLAIVKIVLLAIFIAFCFCLVWLVSHAINVMILLSPFSTVDCLLKMFRVSVIVILIGASLVNPYLGLSVALLIVVIAYFLAGRAFRFMVFGSLFSFDVLLRRSKNYDPLISEIGVFSGKHLPRVPAMSYGKLKKEDPLGLKFTYKPWLIFPSRTIHIKKDGCQIGKGFLSPIVLKEKKNKTSYYTYFRLRPKYKTNEISAAEILGITSIRDVSIVKGIKEGWIWLCEQLKFKEYVNTEV
jgi:hypothetical protein